jgi:glutaconate CoA-transferase subunit B
MTTKNGYSPNELLICVASRLMEDETTAFIGTGIPMLAASLAQRQHAPNLMPIFEFGGMGARLERLPLAVGDMWTFHRGLMAAGICDAMEFAQLGFVDYGFLGGAQIDAYGNLNSTVIGEQKHPKVRLPGSGGANDVGSCCWNTIILMQHSNRRFLEKIDFLTTPGYLTGPGAREEAGLPANTGPYRVVTNLATLDFHPESKRMRLIGLNPGVTKEQVLEETGFELLVADTLEDNAPPSAEELRLLRDEIDKDRYYI